MKPWIIGDESFQKHPGGYDALPDDFTAAFTTVCDQQGVLESDPGELHEVYCTRLPEHRGVHAVGDGNKIIAMWP